MKSSKQWRDAKAKLTTIGSDVTFEVTGVDGKKTDLTKAFQNNDVATIGEAIFKTHLIQPNSK